MIGIAQAGDDRHFDDAGFPLGQSWDDITFPTTVGGIYTLEISGDSMWPLYHDGDRVLVDPHNN